MAAAQTRHFMPHAPTSAALSLIAAIGGPEDLQGAPKTLDLVRHALEHASLAGIAVAADWLSVAQSFSDYSAKVLADRSLDETVGRALAGAIPLDNKVYKLFGTWTRPLIEKAYHSQALAALGRALIAAASRKTVVPPKLVSGVLRLTRDSKKIDDRAWTAVAENFPADGQAAKRLKDQVEGSAALFLQDLRKVYDSTLDPPTADPLEPQGALPRQLDEQRPDRPTPASSRAPASVDASEVQEDGHHGPPLALKSRLAAAHHEVFGPKLGLTHQWNRLPPKALAKLTRQLALDLDPGAKAHVFSVLAIVSLVSATPAKPALEIPLEPKPGIDIRLDVGAGQLFWLFEAYCAASSSTSSPAPDHQSRPEQREAAGRWFPVPLPSVPARALRRLKALRPTAEYLGPLLGVLPTDMEAYGVYLRALGDPAFPPYPARFARSIGVIYIDSVGSDLAAASLGQYFAAAAPSSLRYFSPTKGWIQETASKAYQVLGLGDAETMERPEELVGSPRMLTIGATSAGWTKLTRKLNLLTQALFDETEPHAVLRLAGEVNAALAAAFVISTAHRGSQLQRLTWRALLAHPSCMSVSDKDESQPRAVPRTKVAACILAVLARVAHRVAASAAALGRSEPLATSTDPAFISYSVMPSTASESLVVQAHPIDTGAVAALVRECFGGEVNAGRHAWITHLGMGLVDRWLIRALAGHGTESTQPFGAQTDVPMLQAMCELRDAMDRTFPGVFGAETIDPHIDQPACDFRHGLLVRCGLERPEKPTHGVVSPHAVLRPPTSDVLADAVIVDEMRLRLTSGKHSLGQTASLALHLMLFEPLPDVDAGIDIALRPDQHLRTIHRTCGAEVALPHFVHKLWLPLSPPTLGAISLVPTSLAVSVERAKVAEEILDWLLTLRPAHGTPRRASPERILERLVDSWRRLNLPPSLHALLHPDASPPVPSSRSLHRLAGWATGECVRPPLEPLPSAPDRRRYSRGEDLKRITSILGKYSAKNESIGAKPRRAAETIDALNDADPDFSPLCQSIVKVYVAELRDSVHDAPGSLKVSSIATCNSWLMRGFSSLNPSEDLSELDDDDWQRFCANVRQTDAPIDPRRVATNEGAVFALTRFIRRVVAVYPELGADPLALIGERALPAPRNSASAVFLLPPDFEGLNEDIDHTFAERPIDQAMLHGQARLMDREPARTGEKGALVANALTADQAMAYEDNGFGTAKSKSATRLVELDEPTSSTVASLCATARALKAKYLFRVDIGDLRVSSFEQQSAFLLRSLKRVTGDEQACRHSARAHALQQNTWPGWQACVATLFTQTTSSIDCQTWAAERFSARHRTNAAKQAVAAGHAGLQASHGYYLSAWPLIAAVVLRGLLAPAPPGPAVVDRVGLNHGALRQARSRATAAGQTFDAWQWLAQRLKPPVVKDPQEAHQTAQSAPLSTDHPAPPAARTKPHGPASRAIDVAAATRYVMQRALDSEQHIAMAVSGLLKSQALVLERFLPSITEVLEARQRIKGDIGGRALAADRQRATSDQATLLLHWLLTLKTQDRRLLQLLASDDRAALQRQSAVFKSVEYWKRLVAHMPATQALRIRFGQRHLLAEEQLALDALSPAIVVTRDRDRGQVPSVLLTTRGADDRVASARDTALLRLTALAIGAVTRTQSVPAQGEAAHEVA